MMCKIFIGNSDAASLGGDEETHSIALVVALLLLFKKIHFRNVFFKSQVPHHQPQVVGVAWIENI